MSAYLKTVLRTVKSNFARFIAITAVVMLGLAFVSGLGAIPPIYEETISGYYKAADGADMIVKSKSTGFSDGDLETLAGLNGVEEIQPVSSFDTATGYVSVSAAGDGGAEYNARVYYLPFGDMNVNPATVADGRMPEKSAEIIVDRMIGKNVSSVSPGDKLNLSLFGSLKTEVTVVGIAENPLYFTREGEPDIEAKELDIIVYLDSGVTPLTIRTLLPDGHIVETPPPVTDVFVRMSGAETLNVFSDEYREKSGTVKAEIEKAFGESVACLTSEENYSLALTEEYSDKIKVISLIFPLFFIAVAALVVLTTMTRLVEEERSVIACYKTLGCGNAKIAFKYVGFSAACCALGAVIGIFAGVWILPAAIFPAFDALFFFPELIEGLHVGMGVISGVIMTVAAALVTAYAVFKDLKSKPAELLRPKAPKPGKKIFLEHVPFIWNRLKFKYKSTYRNIFRYVGHLIMTVVSVAGSTALVLAGFGLRDVSLNEDVGILAGFADTFALISMVIILFAAALCVLVIYNLTNMNISERKREIATLKVLGYRDSEVSGYIYREVLIMAVFGIIIGLPLGFGLLYFVFGYLDFGSVSMVKWYSYLISAILVLVFVGFVDLLLFRKIRKVNMNDSLKTLE
ncbi:MAG: ABC transporter permease [Christensenellales bacterium]